MAIIMTLWMGIGAVLKSSSQWRLIEYSKLYNSDHELFIFKILLNASERAFGELNTIYEDEFNKKIV